MKIEYLEEISSTNDYIKRYLTEQEDRIVCASRQTSGKGTKGRSFLSEEGGIYLSWLKFYRDFPANCAFRIMAHAAVSVCRTVSKFTFVRPEIKWPNDILMERKKLCGILIENILCGDRVHASVVGIGLNVRNELSSLGNIAVSLSEFAPEVEMEKVREELIENLQRESEMNEYFSFIRFLGKQIVVTENGESYFARADSILPDGRLQIDQLGVKRIVSAGEISIKL